MLRIFVLLLLIPFALFAERDRRPSPPYISGDGFRSYCDFIFDDSGVNFIPEQVRKGHTIFVKTDYLDRFVRNYHIHIQHPYILITHNSDHPSPGHFDYLLDDPRIIAWFSSNTEGLTHPKLHPLPLGIANRVWGHGNPDTFTYCRERKDELIKEHLLYLNCTVSTCPSERGFVYQLFSPQSYCHVASLRYVPDYLFDLARSKFVLSPRGNGLDCHRLWESLLMESIPIVKTSSLDVLYKGLPVLVIQQWEDITPEFLEDKYKELSQKNWEWDRLFINYWYKQIEAHK